MKTFILLFVSIFFISSVHAVKYDKLKPSALYERAIKYLDKQDYAKANKALKAYTKSEPDDADGWNLYAYSNRKMNKFEKAEMYYEKALNLSATFHINKLGYDLSKLYYESGDYEKVLQQTDDLKKMTHQTYPRSRQFYYAKRFKFKKKFNSSRTG